MKILRFSFLMSLLIIFLASCGGGGGDDGPTPKDQRLALLAKTWGLDTAVPNAVTLDGADISGDFTGFQLIFTTTSYSTQNGSATFDVWNASGNFTFGTNPDNSENLNVLILDGSLMVNIDNISDTKLTISFDFSTASPAKAGRFSGIEGTYVFAMATP